MKPKLNERHFSHGLIKFSFLVAVVYFVGRMLAEQLALVDFSNIEISFFYVFGAALFEILARFFVGLGYYMILKSFHPDFSITSSVAISWVSNLGRYLPGKIALIASSIYLLKQRGVKLRTAASVPILNVLLTIIIALLLSLPLVHPNRTLAPYLGSAMLMAALFGIALPLGAKQIRLPSFVPPLNLPHGDITLDSLNIKSCLGIVLVQCICAGLSTWMICQTFVAVPHSLIGWFVSITAFAGVMGLIAFFSPSGLGVRDGLYLMLLGQVIGPEKAALTTILLRLLQTTTDILLAITGYGLLKLNHRSSGQKEHD